MNSDFENTICFTKGHLYNPYCLLHIFDCYLNPCNKFVIYLHKRNRKSDGLTFPLFHMR